MTRGIRWLRLPALQFLGGLLVVAGVGAAAFGAAPLATLAAWNDTEDVGAALGALDCQAPAGRFDTAASGRVLGGTLAANDLDQIAALQGVAATRTASGTAVQPAASTSLGNDAYSNPLAVSVLGSTYASLGGTLQVPLGAQAGALGGYARVDDSGRSTGAAGLVDDSGAISTSATGSNPPEIAEVRLGAVVQQVLGQTLASRVSGLTDARIRVGDVASRTSLDACPSFWGASIYGQLVRQYYVAGLRVDLDTPAVAGLTGAVSTTLTGIEARAEAARSDTVLLASVRQGVASTVAGLLGALTLGTVDVTALDLTIDLSTANALLATRFSDPSGIATVDPAAGRVSIDIARLVGQVYGSTGLNGLPPNTQILIDGPLLAALRQALTTAVAAWADQVTAAIQTALNTARVTANVSVTLLSVGAPVATITLGLVDQPLGTLVAGGSVASSSTALIGLTCGANPLSLGCIVSGVVGAIVTPLRNAIGGILGSALKTALTGAGGLFTTIDGEIDARVTPFVDTVAGLTRGVFGPSGLLSIAVNAQNAPDPLSGATGAEPAWNVPAPANARETRRFDTAALRLVGVGALATGIGLDFARSSAGRNAVR